MYHRKKTDGITFYTVEEPSTGRSDVWNMHPSPLSGTFQEIAEPYRIGPEVAPVKMKRRVYKDQLGNVIKREKAPLKRGSRLQPYKMNPVLIQKIESMCADADVEYMGMARWPYVPAKVLVKGPAANGNWRATSWVKNYSQAWPVDANLKNKAIIACLEKLSSPRNLDLGVGLAEIGDSIRFIKSPLKSVQKLIRTFVSKNNSKMRRMKRQRATARELVDATANTWLEYRYAFSPMASDLTGAMIECSEKLSTSSEILRRVSGRAKKEVVFPLESFQPAYPYGNVNIHQKGDVRVSQTQTVTAVQLYKYRPFYEDAIKLASLGLSPTQLPSFVWETTRLSFVVDWAVDVGSWLRAWEIRPWIEILDSCVSTVTESLVTTTGCKFGWTTYADIPPGIVRATQLNRTIEILAPPTLPIVSDEVLNLFRTLDSLSLAWKPIQTMLSKIPLKR